MINLRQRELSWRMLSKKRLRRRNFLRKKNTPRRKKNILRRKITPRKKNTLKESSFLNN